MVSSGVPAILVRIERAILAKLEFQKRARVEIQHITSAPRDLDRRCRPLETPLFGMAVAK